MNAMLTMLLILVPAPAPDDEPAGVAPTLKFLKWNKGAFEATETVIEHRTELVTETMNVDGQLVRVARAKIVPVLKTVNVKLDAKGAEVYGLDGKKIDESVWQKALGSGAVVIVANDGQLPHPGFRKVFKEGTLIVVFKPLAPEAVKIAVPSPNGPKN